MAAVGDWAALRQELIQQQKNRILPKKSEDWFFLRERWNRYTADQRLHYLSTALGRYLLLGGSELDVVEKLKTDLPIEQYSNEQKKMIAKAITDSDVYAKLDHALIDRLKQRKRQVEQEE